MPVAAQAGFSGSSALFALEKPAYYSEGEETANVPAKEQDHVLAH